MWKQRTAKKCSMWVGPLLKLIPTFPCLCCRTALQNLPHPLHREMSSLTHLTHRIGPVHLRIVCGRWAPYFRRDRAQEAEEWEWVTMTSTKERTFILWPTASPNVACFTKRLGKRKSLPDHCKSADKRCWGKSTPGMNRFHRLQTQGSQGF